MLEDAPSPAVSAEPPFQSLPQGQATSARAQFLATEHWSLLASRSTTQSEVLTRISMFLTLTSAALVSLALVGQATGFSGVFPVFAIAVLGFVTLVGLLTQIRVTNVGIEDLMYVVAMNRLRGAYVELDPGIDRYLMASHHDDRAGSEKTYFFLGNRTNMSQVLGSSMVFIAALNSAMVGLLIAAIAGILSAPLPVSVVLGMVFGIGYLAIAFWRGGRRYFGAWNAYTPAFPSPSSSQDH